MDLDVAPLRREAATLLAEVPHLAGLCESFEWDPYAIWTAEQPVRRAERWYQRLSSRVPHDHMVVQLHALFSLARKVDLVFPTEAEIRDELLPLADPLRQELPFHTTSVNLSSPASFPSRVSINVIIRLYSRAFRDIVKIRVGLFADEDGVPFWEVGYVDVRRSLQRFRRNFIDREPPATDYFLLQRLVDCVRRFIRRREVVRDLDLTPAYYHVLPLCVRLGGQPQGIFDRAAWNGRIVETYRHSLAQISELPEGITLEELEKVNRRYAISWFFEQGLMRDPDSNRPVRWTPPRLVARAR
jgi:hypothetical protein